MQPTELQTRLENELMDVEFEAIAPHVARDAVVLIQPEVPLVKVAMAISLDLAADVEAWLKDGTLRKITVRDTEGWSGNEKFRFLIVQPFVLIQRAEHIEA